MFDNDNALIEQYVALDNIIQRVKKRKKTQVNNVHVSLFISEMCDILIGFLLI